MHEGINAKKATDIAIPNTFLRPRLNNGASKVAAKTRPASEQKVMMNGSFEGQNISFSKV
jgi:hypothetical protein